MAAGHDARAAGERVEELLAELRTRAGPQAAQVAEELVSCLVELYGAGLAAIVSMLADEPRLLARMTADPLVESLLLVHDLHPADTGTRIERAIGRVREARAVYLGIDDHGVVRLRLEQGGHGCGSSAAAARAALERAVLDAAPETAGVDIEVAPAELPLLQITTRPSARVAR